jgi:hypothetical protein
MVKRIWLVLGILAFIGMLARLVVEILDATYQTESLSPNREEVSVDALDYTAEHEMEKEERALESALSYEKQALLHSQFGNYTNARKEKISRPEKVKLKMWEPYYVNVSRIARRSGLRFSEVRQVEFEYDEIWSYTEEGTESKHTLYWLKDGVQTFSLEKMFTGNPYSGERFSPTYKIVQLRDRKGILAQLAKK